MAEFLTTQGTSYQIERIILLAEKFVCLVSPYLKLSKTFLERLKDANERNVAIAIIYGKEELKDSEKEQLARLSELKLFFSENLHAKCYLNEKDMVITSMNMYEFSEKNNREMGVHINKAKDRALYDNAYKEVKSIIKAAEQQHFEYDKEENETVIEEFEPVYGRKRNQDHKGYCIRCQKQEPFDPEKPYCYECYLIWAQYENYDYEENYCHCCGNRDNSSMNYPQCRSCYFENNSNNRSIMRRY